MIRQKHCSYDFLTNLMYSEIDIACAFNLNVNCGPEFYCDDMLKMIPGVQAIDSKTIRVSPMDVIGSQIYAGASTSIHEQRRRHLTQLLN